MAPDLFLLSSTSVHGYAPFEHALPALADFVGDARQILFAPYAIVDQEYYTRRVGELMAPLGIEIVGLHAVDDPREAVEAAEVLFVGGGNSFRLLASLWELGLIEPIRRISPHPKMLLITSDLSVGHPLVRQVGGTWVSRVARLWITAGVIHRLQHETLAPGTKATLLAYAKRDLEMLVEDIRRQQPDVIVMENEQFDWDNWAASQPELAEELKAYRVAERIGYFFILQRVRD